MYSSGVFAAPTHGVSYDPETQMLNVQTDLCLYGRGIQQALVETSYKNLNNYLRVEYRNIATDIANTHNLKKVQRQYIEYLLTLKLNKSTMQHEYRFEGNDTCTQARANFELNDHVKFESLFDFPPPSSLFFVANSENLEQVLKEKLIAFDTAIKPELFTSHLVSLDNLVEKNQNLTFYQFDLDAYKSSLTQASNSVFVIAKGPYVKLLEQYLQSKSYSIQSSSDNAYWTLRVNANIESQKYLSLQIQIENKDGFQTTLFNNPRQLPATTLGNPVMLEKFFTVHLELMKLNDQLQPDTQ